MAVEQFAACFVRQMLAGLFLAGFAREPRPPGFALHCVFVIHAPI